MENSLTLTHVDLFGAVERLAGISDKTRETYMTCMASYNSFCSRNMAPHNIDSLKAWIESSKKPSTQSLRIAAARKIFGAIYKDHPQIEELKRTISENKPAKRELEVSENKYVTSEELEKIISTAPLRIALIIKTLFQTGFRISPALSIEHENCAFVSDGRAVEILVVSKGNRQSRKHISRNLYEEIISVFGKGRYLFEHNGKPYNRKYISLEIKRAGEIVGKNISAHSIRHSRAEQLMRKDVTIDKVSKFLDHLQLNTTARFYLHSKPSLEELDII